MPFKPKRLPRRSVEVPLQPRWRILGREEEERLRARAVEQHERFRAFGPRRRRRLVRYVIGTSLGLAAIGWLFVSGDVRTVSTHLLVGVPLGAIVAWTYPGDFATGALYAVAGFVATLLSRPGGSSFGTLLMAFLAALLLGSIGIALGRAEENKRMDLEE